MSETDTATAPEATPEVEKDPLEQFITRGEERTVITFRDVQFHIPTDRGKWPTRAMQAFQKRFNADGVELVLGPQQWNLFNTLFPTLAEFREFFPIFARAGGMFFDE